MFFTYAVNKIGGYYALRQRFLNSKSSFSKKYYSFLLKGFQNETNAYLPFVSEIKGPVNFIHSTYGVFISGGASIGKNCTIYQQVTIGSNMLIDSKRLGSPTIGDNCLIGAGAKIIGNISVGNNCRIGANAVVTQDLPNNSVIVLSDAKIYQKENMNNNIYQQSKNRWGYQKNGVFVIEEDEHALNSLNAITKIV